MRFSLNVVNGLCRHCATITQAVLTQMMVALKNTCALDIPLATVTALMPALALLMLLPAFITMLIAVA